MVSLGGSQVNPGAFAPAAVAIVPRASRMSADFQPQVRKLIVSGSAWRAAPLTSPGSAPILPDGTDQGLRRFGDGVFCCTCGPTSRNLRGEDAIRRPMKATAAPQKEGPRTNRDIRVPTVQLIDAQGQNRGPTPTEEALQLAEEAGLDLVE